MLSILFLGFLIGLRHALEADHVAAISSIAARQSDVAAVLRHGVTWGIGHSLALLAFAGAAVLFDTAASERLASWLEAAVGVMLILLGGQVVYRLLRDRVHFHFHRHGDGTVHLHAHSHRDESGRHDAAHHAHAHGRAQVRAGSNRWPLRTLSVGIMHGMAGSAALIVLAAGSVESRFLGLAYVALFGVGSIVGMGALSAVIAAPLAYSARAMNWATTTLQAIVGVATMGLGFLTIYQSAGTALA